jgi:Leucine-rich repeat (LRR) protein
MRFIDELSGANNKIGSIPAHIFGKLTHLKMLNLQQKQLLPRTMPTQVHVAEIARIATERQQSGRRISSPASGVNRHRGSYIFSNKG